MDAGWYPDPSDQSLQRYWDGEAWTPHTAPVATVAAHRPGGGRRALVVTAVVLVGLIGGGVAVWSANRGDDDVASTGGASTASAKRPPTAPRELVQYFSTALFGPDDAVAWSENGGFGPMWGYDGKAFDEAVGAGRTASAQWTDRKLRDEDKLDGVLRRLELAVPPHTDSIQWSAQVYRDPATAATAIDAMVSLGNTPDGDVDGVHFQTRCADGCGFDSGHPRYRYLWRAGSVVFSVDLQNSAAASERDSSHRVPFPPGSTETIARSLRSMTGPAD